MAYSGLGLRQGRAFGSRVVLIALSLGLATATLRALSSSDYPSQRDGSADLIPEARLFGFVSAALTACDFKEGPDWPAFERSVAALKDDAAFLKSVSDGLAAFDREANAKGQPEACAAALEAHGSGRSTAGTLLIPPPAQAAAAQDWSSH